LDVPLKRRRQAPGSDDCRLKLKAAGMAASALLPS
jgi:hypothetical protein